VTDEEESPEQARLRAEVRSWLAANRPADGSNGRAFRKAVIDAGWAAPSWPVEWYGKGLPMALSRVVAEEFAAAGAAGSGQDASNLWANTVLAFGSDDLKQRFLEPLLLGEIAMCLLYSEPGAGSDLAAVQTRADRDGDEWIVNGQKVWTSSAKEADFGMLIARTNWDVPKHRGISFFFLPMKQPGVEVRPIRQATGDARFNEVFITDARVPHANLVGPVDDGWRVLQTALMYERMVLGGVSSRARTTSSAGASETPMTARRYEPTDEPTFRPPDTDLTGLAREQGKNDDPLIRQELARLSAMRTVNTWNGLRARAEMQQGSSSPAASLGKLAMSHILHGAGHLEGLILGMTATLTGREFPRAAAHNYSQLNAYFTSIGGGTDQIQRNIIGERILGLPKEPEVDKDVTFRDVRKATTTSGRDTSP
jgi:alkylation response protein AidB-like acyl-CoA dehydrogenase